MAGQRPGRLPGEVILEAMKCGGCPHAGHRGRCRGKGPSRCVPLVDETGRFDSGFACGSRPPCPCSWRTCKCGTDVAIAILDKDQAEAFNTGHGLDPATVIEVPVIRGSAQDPAGRLAVRKLPDGTLACRELADGEIGEGWRGVEHTGECQPL